MRQATAVQADAQADAPAAQAPKAKAGPANEDELLQKIYDSIGDATQQAELTKQKALVDARARSALSGAGFAGAQSAQEADIAGQMDAQARQQLLNQAGQLLDLQRSDKAFKLKEQEIESVLDQDLNGDGVIGGKAVGKDGVGDRNTENDDKEAIKDEINALLDGMATSSGGVYQPTKAEKRQLEEAGVSFRETERRAPGGAHIYEDDDGNLYVFADGKNTETLDEFFKRVFG
jgi:hypothetical protein